MGGFRSSWTYSHHFWLKRVGMWIWGFCKFVYIIFHTLSYKYSNNVCNKFMWTGFVRFPFSTSLLLYRLYWIEFIWVVLYALVSYGPLFCLGKCEVNRVLNWWYKRFTQLFLFLIDNLGVLVINGQAIDCV